MGLPVTGHEFGEPRQTITPAAYLSARTSCPPILAERLSADPMAISAQITALFLDVGGVLLTNGWDHTMRERAANRFQLDRGDLDERHHLTFDTYEEGKLSLDDYLSRVIFYEPRPFTRDEFRQFMFSQSQPFPEMIDLIRDLRSRYGLKIVVVSNEGRELATYRIDKFHLAEIVDFFIVSAFVHFRKPDADIFKMALDVAHVPPDRVAYVEDRAMFVDVARGLGIRGIHHTGYDSTRAALAALGLTTETAGPRGAEGTPTA
jgi:putative hydrolase of the HAD superfamily